MLSRLKLPTREEVVKLAKVRADVCVSIYAETSPMKMLFDYCRLELSNMVRAAFTRLEYSGFNKRRLSLLKERLAHIAGDDDFCLNQANSVCILATPDHVEVYRLANHLNNQIEIADRFYLKPLMRALTFSQTALILALSENGTKVIGLFPESEPEVIAPPNMPENAYSQAGPPLMLPFHRGRDNTPDGTERKIWLSDYAKKVDEAIEPLTRQGDRPVILAAAEPLASIYRSVAASPLTGRTINIGPDRVADHELVNLARPALDEYYAMELAKLHALFETRAGQRRVATEVSDVARAATYGMVSLILVDFDRPMTGIIDENGDVRYTDEPGSYGIIDEIVKRSLENGARIMAVREPDMIGDSGVAAVLRYPLSPPEVRGPHGAMSG
ncbi:hypothetical protein C4J81_15255 [Deltaproteobacteria bacterium Smac51]|nr:hypothetical protein C4J81_15255 [Deltaproteobacteria bacterium Smac51]